MIIKKGYVALLFLTASQILQCVNPHDQHRNYKPQPNAQVMIVAPKKNIDAIYNSLSSFQKNEYHKIMKLVDIDPQRPLQDQGELWYLQGAVEWAVDSRFISYYAKRLLNFFNANGMITCLQGNPLEAKPCDFTKELKSLSYD